MALSPTLADIILAALDTRMDGVFTAMPGRIVGYDYSEQSAAVQPGVMHSYDNESGERVSEPLPVLQRVPVLFMGGGGYRTVYPIGPGDSCLLVFANCSLDRWLASGGATIVDPEDDRRHTLHDAIAIVGLRTFVRGGAAGGPSPLMNVPTDHMSVGDDEGASIEIYPDEVRVGGDDVDETAADKNAVVVQSALDDFMTAVSNAITTAGDPLTPSPSTVEVLGYLKAALDALGLGAGWKAGTVVAKAK